MLFAKYKKRLRELAEALEGASRKIAGLERQLALSEGIIKSMAEGVIVVGNNTQIIAINPSVEKIFDIKKGASEGRYLLEVIRNNDIAELINDVLKNGESISREIRLAWPVQAVFHINAAPIFEKGNISGCLTVIHDITEIRKLETMRRDFVANVSHELKTPLTSIKGFVETLLEGAIDDKENNRNFLKIINEHANRLEVLVGDLLSLSRLESGGMALKKEPVRLREIAERSLTQFKSALNNKSLNFSNDLAADLSVNADADKLEQIFTNLIDNAVKFNRKNGSIKIYGQPINGSVKITIEDTGLGIPPKDIPRIFERFYRVDKARSHEFGGTGLGLSIVKHIVELHGGSVGVESTEGLGSKFWFILPK